MRGFSRTFFVVLIAIAAIPAVFAQTANELITVGKYDDIGKTLKKFATYNAGRQMLTADVGLMWSDAYIGELIHFPPHYGAGISLGMNGLRSDGLNRFVHEAVGAPALEAVFAESQFFYTYVIEFRLGGFRDLPFDVGFKGGYLPAVSPFFGDSFKYGNMQFGGDLRYNLQSNRWAGFKMSLAFAINYLDGYMEMVGFNQQWSDTGGAGGGSALDPQKGNLRVFWNNLSFNLKLVFEKTWPSIGMTFFGSVIAGYGLTKTGVGMIGNVKFGGKAIGDMNGQEITQTQDAVKSLVSNDSEWTIGALGGGLAIYGVTPVNQICINSYEGLAFNFENDTTLQIALMFDIWNLEYGVTIGYRWQNKSF